MRTALQPLLAWRKPLSDEGWAGGSEFGIHVGR